jgi:CRP-like cAMP-binding protein
MQQRLLMTTEQLNTVRNMPLFDGLSETDKSHLLEGGSLYGYARKQPLFLQGDSVKYFYIVCDGIVQEMRQTKDGREITSGIHMVGNTLGGMEMFLPSAAHTTTAMAVEDCLIMELPLAAFRDKLLQRPAAIKAMLSTLAHLALQKRTEVEQQATLTSTDIVADYLRQLCGTLGLDPRGFTLPYKKSLIASRLGMELETFSRTLPKLRAHGIVVSGTQVRFLAAGESATEKRRPAHTTVIPFPTRTTAPSRLSA